MYSSFLVKNRIMRRLLSLLLVLLSSAAAMAQQTAAPEVSMADQLRADGKIWVVVGVIALVFIGIIVYLVRLDGQIGKLEKEIKTKS